MLGAFEISILIRFRALLRESNSTLPKIMIIGRVVCLLHYDLLGFDG